MIRLIIVYKHPESNFLVVRKLPSNTTYLHTSKEETILAHNIFLSKKNGEDYILVYEANRALVPIQNYRHIDKRIRNMANDIRILTPFETRLEV